MTFQTVRKARTSSKGRADRAFQECTEQRYVPGFWTTRINSDERVGMDFQNCAEAWMPEPKRHMDVLERVLEIHSHLLLHQSLKRGIA